jgi:membrane-associated phospholipid phosphatase
MASMESRGWDERRTQAAMLAGLVAYLVITHTLIGLRTEHLVLAGVAFALVAWGGAALRFTLLVSPVVLTGISYDLFRVLVPYRGEVHIADLYSAEVALFGINGEVPALWLESHTYPAVDLVTGVSYILYMYVPMASAVAFHWIDKRKMLLIGVAFFATNFVGMVVYMLYPAAPPWYVAIHGLGPIVRDAVPNAAGAARFDALIGVDYFTTFYKRSANVFGAMPSLHVAYPMSTLLALWGSGKKWTVPIAVFVVVVAFAAVYLQHHYILDVIAGLACAGAGYSIAKRVVSALPEPTHA